MQQDVHPVPPPAVQPRVCASCVSLKPLSPKTLCHTLDTPVFRFEHDACTLVHSCHTHVDLTITTAVTSANLCGKAVKEKNQSQPTNQQN